jgi:hypothetical protein
MKARVCGQDTAYARAFTSMLRRAAAPEPCCEPSWTCTMLAALAMAYDAGSAASLAELLAC